MIDPKRKKPKDLDAWRNPDGSFPDKVADMVTITDPLKRKVVARIANTVIPHHRYLNAWRWLEEAATLSGAGMEDQSGILCGDPGVGKTTLLRQFVSQRAGPFVLADGSEIRPVVRVVTPSNTSKRSLFDATLDELGASDLATGTDNTRKLVLRRQLEVQQVRLMIFDEFTHVVEDRTQHFTRMMAREVKEILSEGRCACIFAGTRELRRLNDLYAQLRRRSFGDVELTPFEWDEGEDSEEWTTILQNLPRAMLIKPELALHEGVTPMLIHQATDGLLDTLMKFLARASMHAYDRHREGAPETPLEEMSLTGVDLWWAFEALRRGSNAPNPFERHRPKRRPAADIYVQPYEPFDPEEEASGLSGGPRKNPETFNK